MKISLAAILAVFGFMIAPQLGFAAHAECDDLAIAADDMEEFKNWLDEAEEVEIDAAQLKEMRRAAKDLKKAGDALMKDTHATKSEKQLGKALSADAATLDKALGGKDLDTLILAYENVVDSLDDLTAACDAQ